MSERPLLREDAVMLDIECTMAVILQICLPSMLALAQRTYTFAFFQSVTKQSLSGSERAFLMLEASAELPLFPLVIFRSASL
jgi:hypothetical protein